MCSRPRPSLVIVDWDFVRLAPPERDLWDLAENDRSVLAAYAKATGTAIDFSALALFRMWYDLSEIAGYLDLFRAAHNDTEDTAESWKNLEYFLRPAQRHGRSYSLPAAEDFLLIS